MPQVLDTEIVQKRKDNSVHALFLIFFPQVTDISIFGDNILELSYEPM